MPDSYTTPWYVVQSKPNTVKMAVQNLELQGYQVVSPLENHTYRRGMHFVTTPRPYFAGYFFVGLSQQANFWQPIRSTRGVSQLIFFDQRPAEIPAEFIQELQKRIDIKGRLLDSHLLKSGDRIHVTRGPFVDLMGRVESASAKDRVWVLLDFFGQSTRVRLDRSVIRQMP